MLPYEQAVLDLDPVIYLPMREANSGAPLINLAVSELGKPNFPGTPTRNNITYSAAYPTPALQPESSAVGSWEFNGTTSYVALVDGTYNGFSVNIPGWNTAPGDSLEQWTIGVWINMEGASGSAVWRDIFRVSDYGTGFAIFTGATATTFETFRAFTYDGSGTFYGQDRSAKFTEGGWHFLWAQFDGTRYRTGIDDWWVVLKSTDIPSSTGFGFDSSPFIALGRNGQYSQEYFKGKMSHFMMFDYAVDRTALYNLFDLAIDLQDTRDLSNPTRELEEKSTGPRIDVTPIRESMNTLPAQGDGMTLVKDNLVVNFEEDYDIWYSGVDLIELTPNKFVSLGTAGSTIVYTILERNPVTDVVTLLTYPTMIGSYTSVSNPYFVRLSSTKILFCYTNSTAPRIREAILTFDDATNTMTAGSGTTLFSTVYANTQSIDQMIAAPLKLDDNYIIRSCGAASAVANSRSPNFLVYHWNPATNTLTAAATNQFQPGSFDGRLNGRTSWPGACMFKISNTKFAFMYKRAGNQPNNTSSSQFRTKVVIVIGTWNGSTITFSEPQIWQQNIPEGWPDAWTYTFLHDGRELRQYGHLFRVEDSTTGSVAPAQSFDALFKYDPVDDELKMLREYVPHHSFAVDDGTQLWIDSWWYFCPGMAGDSRFQFRSRWAGSGDILEGIDVQRVVFEPEHDYIHYCRPRELFQAGPNCMDVGPLGSIYLGDNKVMLLYQAYREATPGQGWDHYKTELRADIYEMRVLNGIT